MYAVIRRYRFDAQNSENIDRSVEQDFLPVVSELPGFVAYYWVNTGDGVGVSVSVFKDQAAASASTHAAAEFARPPASLAGVPEIIKGEVQAHAKAS
jgi:hypothetical protein